MSDYSKLQELAEKATPGPWDRSDGNEVSVSYEGDEAYWEWENAGPAQLHGSGEQPIADADFVAAANPATVLALLAEIKRLRTAEGDAMTYKAGMENVAQQRDQIRAERDQLFGNSEQLKAENEALRSQVTRLAAECVREADKVVQAEADCAEAEGLIARMSVQIDKASNDSARLDWFDTKFTNIVEGQCYHDPHGELVGREWSVGGPHSEVRDAIDAAMSKAVQ